jgi:ribosomal protein uS11
MVGGVAKQPTAEDLLKEELGAVKVRKAKGSKNVTSGFANVLASFNNTIVSITDPKGQVIAWSSAGKCNFRGSRKSTAYAAQIVAQDAARNAMSHGLKDVVIRVSGPGLGRDSAIRALQAIGLEITSIVDVTPIPTTAAGRASAAASKTIPFPQPSHLKTMARYTGPSTRISRRFGQLLIGSGKALERRNYPPGQHGPKSAASRPSTRSA